VQNIKKNEACDFPFLTNTNDGPTRGIILDAILKEDIGAIERVVRCRKSDLYGNMKKLLDTAAGNGTVEILRLLENNTSDKYSHNAITNAAYHGNLEIIKYLHSKSVDCANWAMYAATSLGHFEIVKFLHENRNDICNENIMKLAIEHRHLDIVKYLHQNQTGKCKHNALNYATLNGDIEIILMLDGNEGCEREE